MDYLVVLAGAAPFGTVVLLAAMAGFTFVISWPVLAFAAVLDHPNNTRALKIASFFLLAFGFQFDLLAA